MAVVFLVFSNCKFQKNPRLCPMLSWQVIYQLISCLIKKAGHKPDSVGPKALPIIYLDHWLPKGSNRLPFSSSVQPSNTDLHGVSPHRVYLVSLQHYLYILSVALVRPAKSGRRVLPAMLHYGVRTFLYIPNLIRDLLNIASISKQVLKQVQYAAIRWPARCKFTSIVDKKVFNPS